jgi:uncharacterized membrane protein YfcA
MGVVEFLYVHFPVSGVDTWVFLPPVVAFVVSFFTSMGGVSGAFLLLPFQMSVLGYTSPSVSGTNQFFNVIAIPSGVYRFIREGRMVWPLTWAVIIGTLPGVFIGAWVRIAYLPDSRKFKLFAALVLLYIGIRLALDKSQNKKAGAQALPGKMRVTDTKFTLKAVEYTFEGKTYSFFPPGVFLLCFVVGIVGGIYGIGGGAIIAPFFVALFGMPVYTVAGAALMGTFITSVAGVLFYQILGACIQSPLCVTPDFFLGALFGIGGFGGMYLGARCQKYVPVRVIKMILCACMLFVAIKYAIDFFS